MRFRRRLSAMRPSPTPVRGRRRAPWPAISGASILADNSSGSPPYRVEAAADEAAHGPPPHIKTPNAAKPLAVVIMGVSGSGKTTVGALLAGYMHWRFEDGDSLHPAANIDKMRRGVPLDDMDRWPWLRAVASVIAGWLAQGQCGVVACSALKRVYRRAIVGDNPDIRLVYLKGSRELLLRRMAARHGHFMPVSLLDSQLETLEEPTPEENPIIVSIEGRPEEIVNVIVTEVAARQAK